METPSECRRFFYIEHLENILWYTLAPSRSEWDDYDSHLPIDECICLNMESHMNAKSRKAEEKIEEVKEKIVSRKNFISMHNNGEHETMKNTIQYIPYFANNRSKTSLKKEDGYKYSYYNCYNCQRRIQ